MLSENTSGHERRRYELSQGTTGWVEVICGCMFAGKSEEMLRRLRRVTIAKQEILLVKPKIDDRYSETEVVSHSGFRMKACSIPGSDPWEIVKVWLEVGKPPVVGIDEGQFFQDLPEVVERIASDGSRVIVAGLDLDYLGRPFLAPSVLSMAEDVTKLTAVCMTCGGPASRTQRLTGGDALIEVGGEGQYEARCRAHWTGVHG